MNEVKLFPLSLRSADNALKGITLNPEIALFTEGQLIMTRNRNLNNMLHVRSMSEPTPRDYIEGALFTHRVVRVHAELHGLTIPTLSFDLCRVYLLEMGNIAKKGEFLEDFANRRIRPIKENDEGFSRVVGELTKYRPSPSSLILGMADVYSVLRRGDQSGQLSQWTVGGN